MQKKTVTILEVIGVLFIILALAAFLFPIFAKAKGGNRHTSCQSNLRQIGLGFAQYTNDYDERFPTAEHWGSEIYPYVKTTRVYQCPDDLNTVNTNNDVTTYPLSYAMNTNLSEFRDKRITIPSATVLATDFDSVNVNMQSSTDTSEYSETIGMELKAIHAWGRLDRLGIEAAPKPTRHDPCIMVLAADGHVKMLNPERISAGVNASQPQSAQSIVHAAGSSALGTTWNLTFSAI